MGILQKEALSLLTICLNTPNQIKYIFKDIKTHLQNPIKFLQSEAVLQPLVSAGKTTY